MGETAPNWGACATFTCQWNYQGGMQMDVIMLIVGLASIAVGVFGPMSRVRNPRNQREREAKGPLMAFALASIGGGAVLTLYALFA